MKTKKINKIKKSLAFHLIMDHTDPYYFSHEELREAVYLTRMDRGLDSFRNLDPQELVYRIRVNLIYFLYRNGIRIGYNPRRFLP